MKIDQPSCYHHNVLDAKPISEAFLPVEESSSPASVADDHHASACAAVVSLSPVAPSSCRSNDGRSASEHGGLVEDMKSSHRKPKIFKKLITSLKAKWHETPFVTSDGRIELSTKVDELMHSPRTDGFVSLQRDVIAVRKAMEQEGVLPELIAAGSSGSYFCRARPDGPIMGVFKPRDEEPYGPHNPKFGKLVQRVLCPCCFGRTCLLRNVGYISEASASVVDCFLGFHLVPETIVTSFSCPNGFNYKKVVKTLAKFNIRAFPRKVGSYQRFVHGYVPGSALTPEQWEALSDDESFVAQFQRLTVLDYIIRNTDRGLDNFLVHIEKRKIAAIDHGLAFPVKHPGEVRLYPYGWLSLPLTQRPYNENLRQDVLSQLTNVSWRHTLVTALRGVMSQDGSFNESDFRHQMAVVSGQISNLVIAMKQKPPLSPYELASLPPYMIYEESSTGEVISSVKAKLAWCKWW
eukprot:PhM_4_TR1365/c0_g2_i2/m.92229/K13711/PI4K2; phosphatidylinositol 4-kinase type 2